MSRIHANNFLTSTNGSISDSVTSIILTSVTGFPVIGGGVTANVTLQNGSDIEIVTATARSSFTLTVTRGAEGTVAKAFASGSTVSIRPTADSIDRKADIASPVFTGTVTIPTPFTLGAVSVLPTGTELNYVDGVTSNIQDQFNSLVAGTPGYTTTATAAGTTTLTASSETRQFFTGSTTQTVVLPVASTLGLGRPFIITNNSSGVVTVQSSGGNTIVAMAALTQLNLTLILTSGTGTSSWDYLYAANGSGITGSGSLVRATSPTLVTPALGTIASGNLSAGTGSLVNLTTITTSADISVHGCVVGKGSGGVSTCVAFGVNALGTTAGTSANTVAIGSGALASITDSNDNVAIGTNALTSCISGVRNFGLGTAALNLNTGNDNVAIGYFASQAGTSGGLNVGIGSNALLNNVTGVENIGIGYGALQGVSTNSFSRNTAIGRSSSNGVTTGTDNTCIGWETGVGVLSGAVGITSGTYNTLIGSSASSNSSTAVGILALGANAIADISTGTGSGDHGAGIALGSASYPVGFAGDGSIIQTAGSSVGYWRVKLNGTYYKFLMLADS